MATIFQDKIFKYLTLGLALLAVGLLVQNLLAKPKPSLSESQSVIQLLPQIPQAALNPKDLENLRVENLKPFEVVGFPSRIGRDDPFEPYPLVEEVATSTPSASSGQAATTSIATTTIATGTSAVASVRPATTTIATTTATTTPR